MKVRAAAAQLDLLCRCGRRPVELKVPGCCRLCYQRRYRSVRFFGGWREAVLKRDRFRCRACGADRRLVVHHRDARNEKRGLITLCIRCHVRLHRYRRIRRWVPEVLLGLWSEIHPGQPLQLQLTLRLYAPGTECLGTCGCEPSDRMRQEAAQAGAVTLKRWRR